MKILERILFIRRNEQSMVYEKKMSGRLVLGLTSVAIFRRPRKIEDGIPLLPKDWQGQQRHERYRRDEDAARTPSRTSC
jgi:hypothetical protein